MSRRFPGKIVNKDWGEDISGREKSRAKLCKRPSMTKRWAENSREFPRYVGPSQAGTPHTKENMGLIQAGDSGPGLCHSESEVCFSKLLQPEVIPSPILTSTLSIIPCLVKTALVHPSPRKQNSLMGGREGIASCPALA